MSGLPSSVEAQTSATRASTSVGRCTLIVALRYRDIDLREIFECAHLKFPVSGRSKQAYIHMRIDTHTRAQCSHASVGLAQARPKLSSTQWVLIGNTKHTG